MATIDDVAKLAGVSKGTVSSVFSKKRPISQLVTARVLEAAKELGYFPNHVARSLAIKKTLIAGLKMPISTDGGMSAFETQMMGGVIQTCTKHGYRVLLDTLPEHDDPTQFSIDPVDGVIMLNPRQNDPRIERYGQMAIPLVLVGRPDPMDEAVCFVDNNNKEVGLQVGDYLLGIGHRSILFLNASSDMTVAFDRQSGLAQAYERHGIPFGEAIVLNFSRKKHKNMANYGYAALLETYGKRPFSAVIADTDRVALGVLRAARELGIAVPDRLSLVALSNDATLAQETTPKLTTVELSAELLGAEAAHILIDKMNNIEGVHQRIVDAKLVIRESCKPLA
ncbi:LacI family transcriptional regulator [Gordoniibacillus kamchatkensis]|uniref:LacI family transcriptional regulator n=1 Tax=Gordoniibacillus kamchatkensis TaxID=1590651 RepID=A0ABR5AJ82_9BACL|nr:LacI family DNA-binding transcriptional regulator [Paenibacillus sp. VKM B-2647]KIL40972.1 LacI family transcriptional regulator [Paenibacillus sp. VKM B-2647]